MRELESVAAVVAIVGLFVAQVRREKGEAEDRRDGRKKKVEGRASWLDGKEWEGETKMGENGGRGCSGCQDEVGGCSPKNKET